MGKVRKKYFACYYRSDFVKSNGYLQFGFYWFLTTVPPKKRGGGGSEKSEIDFCALSRTLVKISS